MKNSPSVLDSISSFLSIFISSRSSHFDRIDRILSLKSENIGSEKSSYLSVSINSFICSPCFKRINIIIRRSISKMINNDKKIKKVIKRARKIDFINLYFKFLSKTKKYKKN